jgi:hypothetical protein
LYSNVSLETLCIPKTNAVPAFYTSLLDLWSEYGNTIPKDKIYFIWYNKDVCINGKSIYYKHFREAGVWYIDDLYQSDGTPIPFKEWVSRGVNPQNVIQWMGLIQKTKHLLVQSGKQMEVTQLAFANKGPLLEVDSKTIYSELLKVKTGAHVCEPNIVKYFIEPVHWSDIFHRANKVPIDTKMKEFQYRFLYDLLANNYWLHKWKIKQSASCLYCTTTNQVENILHMFWECELTQQFWNEVSMFCRANMGDVTIDKEIVFFGSTDEIICNLIYVAKMYIYHKRIHDEPLHLNQFKLYLQKRKSVEFLIAIERHKTEEWMDKWNFLQ